MEKNKSISPLKIAAVYIGTVVGAGFATGQEILQFFVFFGIGGIWGIILSTLLFVLFGVLIMEMGLRLNAKSHLEIVRYSGGSILGSVMDAVILVFLFGALTAMMAGTGAMFKEQFNMTASLGNLVMAILTAMTVLTGLSGVINAISAVVPFLIVSVCAISLHSVMNAAPALSGGASNNTLLLNWQTAAVLYASYNIIMSVSVLGPLGAAANNKKKIMWGGILGGLGLGATSGMIYFALRGNIDALSGLEIPMSYLAAQISPLARIIFSIILIGEIYTTAVGALFGLSARLAGDSPSARKNGVIVISVTALAFIASLLGFSNLVKYLYPVEGYVGIFLLVILLLAYVRHALFKKKSAQQGHHQ